MSTTIYKDRFVRIVQTEANPRRSQKYGGAPTNTRETDWARLAPLTRSWSGRASGSRIHFLSRGISSTGVPIDQGDAPGVEVRRGSPEGTGGRGLLDTNENLKS